MTDPKILEKSGPWWAVESTSRPGCIYYFNVQNGKKSWTKPPSFDSERSRSNVENNTVKQVENHAVKPVEKSSRNQLKMKTGHRNKGRNDNSAAPYPKRRSGEALEKTEKEETKRKNLGSFKHTFNPPAKSANSKDVAKEAPSKPFLITPSSSDTSSSQVSVNIRKQKTPKLTKAPSNVFGVEVVENKSEIETKRTSEVMAGQSSKSFVRTWLTNVPFGVINQPTCPAEYAENNNRREPLHSTKQDTAKKDFRGIRDFSTAPLPKSQTGPAGKSVKRLSIGGVPRFRSGGLAEERLRKLRNELSEEVKGKTGKKKQPAPVPPQGKPKERKALLPTPPEHMKVDLTNHKKDERPAVCQTRIDVKSKPVDDASNLRSEVPCNSTIPPVEVLEIEAMDVDEEAQVLSDIKAMRTTATWESFDTESTPVETEVVGLSSDPRSAVIIVVDTNILLSHLNFVRELRDTTKLYGDHPFLYVPWMVLQELDRCKMGTSKVAKAARAAVIFLNDSFKRKHPRVRGQTGREASRARSSSVQELCPDDSILESCLQLQEQGFQTWLLSNDVSLCNKALVSSIKAVTKIQLTNEIRNSAETNSLLHTGRSPSPVKKVCAMDRLRSASQGDQPPGGQPQPIPTQILKPALSIVEDLKKAVLNTFSQVISTGMEAEYGSLWPKRVLYKPPWEIDKALLCLTHHWFALCDECLPESVKKAANQLKTIFFKGANDNSLDELMDLTLEISSKLSCKYGKIISPLEDQIKAFRVSRTRSSGPVKESMDRSSAEDLPNQNGPNLPSDCVLVLSYFQVLWSIVQQFCSEIRAKLENGITLDTDSVNRSKEILGVMEGLYNSINKVLSVPENEINITFEGLKDLFEVLMNVSPPDGAEPLRLQHVLTFCVHPESRLLLRNGLSQVGECGTLLVNAVKSGKL